MHNQNYWHGSAYLGLGAAAHSFDGLRTRWENPRALQRYLQALLTKGTLVWQQTTLSAEAQFNELVLTRLRTVEGLKLAEVTQLCGSAAAAELYARAESQRRAGLLMILGSGTKPHANIHFTELSLTLSANGKHYADGVIRALMV